MHAQWSQPSPSHVPQPSRIVLPFSLSSITSQRQQSTTLLGLPCGRPQPELFSTSSAPEPPFNFWLPLASCRGFRDGEPFEALPPDNCPRAGWASSCLACLEPWRVGAGCSNAACAGVAALPTCEPPAGRLAGAWLRRSTASCAGSYFWTWRPKAETSCCSTSSHRARSTRSAILSFGVGCRLTIAKNLRAGVPPLPCSHMYL
mmetsp:Transcript_12909/g.41493  ORF Transcript_12909/g.41493 Transcript_12909/m.41493 type:complete len:203 (-) Transcript_12909:962-1570(-)